MSCIFKYILLLASTILLVACSKSVEIPNDKYGLLLQYGKVESYVSGPAIVEKKYFIESVVFLDKKNDALINDDRISYLVTDPIDYYKRFGLGRDRFQQFLSDKMKNRTVQNTRASVLELIEELKLPIQLLSTPIAVYGARVKTLL